MKNQESKDNPKILSIEEYKKKRAPAEATATGDIPQAPARTSTKAPDKTAAILTFTAPRQKSTARQSGRAAPARIKKGTVIYMEDYLKSADSLRQSAPTDMFPSLSENGFSPAQTSAGGNILMMNAYLKRKIPNQRAERDWEKDLQPSRSAVSHKWGAVAVAAVLAVMAVPLLNKSGTGDQALMARADKGGAMARGDKEGIVSLSGKKPIRQDRFPASKIKETDRQPNSAELFPADSIGGAVRRSPQSLSSVEGGLLLSARYKPAETVIKSGRKPTLKERQNGY